MQTSSACCGNEPEGIQFRGKVRDLNAVMSHDFEDNATEGPEGYFVQSASAPRVPQRPAGRHNRRHHDGRRREDLQLRQARRRLLWMNATLGAILTAAAVMAVAERLE